MGNGDEALQSALMSSFLFEGIGPAECMRIAHESGAFVRSYDGEQLIIRMGEKNSAVGIMHSGMAEMGFYDERGRNVIVECLTHGSHLGLSSAILHECSAFQVKAVEPCSVIWLRLDELLAARLETSRNATLSQIDRNIELMLAHESQTLCTRLQMLAQSGLRERLRMYLIECDHPESKRGLCPAEGGTGANLESAAKSSSKENSRGIPEVVSSNTPPEAFPAPCWHRTSTSTEVLCRAS